MERKTTDAKEGFRQAGLWLLAIGWLGLVFAGMAIALTPSPHSPALGWALLALAAVIALVTMNRWVKVFPGLLAYGIFGSILMLADGHAVNYPLVAVSRLEGTSMLVLFAISTILSLTFTNRKLHITDRIALSVFVFCFFWQAAIPNLMSVALGIGFCFLLFAWLYDRFHYHRGRGSRSTSDAASRA